MRPPRLCHGVTDMAGFGRCIEYRKYNATIKRYPNQTQDRIQPPPTDEKGEVHDPYRIVDVDGECTGECGAPVTQAGICMPGMRIENKDVFVNKESPDDTSNDTPAPDSQGFHPAALRCGHAARLRC